MASHIYWLPTQTVFTVLLAVVTSTHILWSPYQSKHVIIIRRVFMHAHKTNTATHMHKASNWIDVTANLIEIVQTVALRFSLLFLAVISMFHTLRVHYAHAAANLNSGYSKYAKVARVHYFCTIALWTSCAVPTWAWASRGVDLRERRVDWFS